MVDKTDPICGMQGHIKAHGHYFCSQHCVKTFEQQGQKEQTSNIPVIILISVLLAAVTLSIFVDGFMRPFMGIFFILVAVLKLMDLNGFIMGFSSYDKLAQAWPFYAKLYPFLELGLGILFLGNFLVSFAAVLTVAIMLEDVYSVSIVLIKKQKFKCACLGSLIAVPLTTFTLLEDVIMLGMAVALILL
jgi:YHS domain-containing protein